MIIQKERVMHLEKTVKDKEKVDIVNNISKNIQKSLEYILRDIENTM
jgi:hypothetical protein